MTTPGNWKLLCALTIVFWGLWTFFAKMASTSLKPTTIGVGVGLVNLVVLLGFGWRDLEMGWSGSHVWIALAGLAAGLGGWCFFQAIRLGEANVIVPVVSLNMLVTAGLAVLFLGESLTWSKMIGYCLGALSLFFLCR